MPERRVADEYEFCLLVKRCSSVRFDQQILALPWVKPRYHADAQAPLGFLGRFIHALDTIRTRGDLYKLIAAKSGTHDLRCGLRVCDKPVRSSHHDRREGEMAKFPDRIGLHPVAEVDN
ncbi:hypothetical protein GCM10010910_27590 [Microbacterium nanhaiense]|uniref:Uncharacterized protein n=1 Tax=Microbacterium nanhaiense TaxID=1301026 RepID=A0ABQ2N3P1_9MICO|nr:hypothetical protein GCM10010910_27590 [Microbacterium nanhaiense]